MPDYEFYNPRGGNWAYFAKNARAIAQFLKQNEIPAAQIGPVASRDATRAPLLIDLGIRGGIRVPHLHLKDSIYLLNAEQWAKFSQGILADAAAKLGKAKALDFDQAMAIGSITQTL